MNKDIDDTIKEITLSIIQFDTDIKTGNSDGISTFLKIIPVLKRYSSLMVPDKYEEKIHFLNFKNEILDLFDYLFIESNIYKVAEGLFKQNGDVKIQGNVPVLKFSPLVSEIEAIRRNKNPLNTIPDNRPDTLKKAIGINHFEAFISKYQGLYNNEKTGSKSIIDTNYISLIYKRYEAYFTEDIDTWIDRFYPNKNQIDPIDIDKKALRGSNRLVLLAILAAIQPYTGAGFDYNDFVLDRFGIKGYEKAKSIHKDKPEFENTFNECNAILMI